MLIRGVILVLKVIEHMWDAYDKIKQIRLKSQKSQVISNEAYSKVKPSYSS